MDYCSLAEKHSLHLPVIARILSSEQMLTCEDDCDDWFEAELTVEDEIPLQARGAESLDPTGYANGTTQDTATSVPKHALSSLS
jgi:hypothetical protein